MPDLSRNPDDYDAYADAHAQAINASHSGDAQRFAVGGTDEFGKTETVYAVEPTPGAKACSITDDMTGAIEDLPDYRNGARIITRTVVYGPWRYVTPDEIEAEVNRYA